MLALCIKLRQLPVPEAHSSVHMCSFEQLGLDAEMTATLSSLYGSIDVLEWPVGVLI